MNFCNSLNIYQQLTVGTKEYLGIQLIFQLIQCIVNHETISLVIYQHDHSVFSPEISYFRNGYHFDLLPAFDHKSGFLALFRNLLMKKLLQTLYFISPMSG